MKNSGAVCAAVLLLGLPAFGATQAPQPVSGKEALDVMKGLAGEWHGTVSEPGAPRQATVTYRVTSAGNAVLETLFPGTDHEMITVYHLDADKLVLTHYCAMGNQPHMVLSKESTAQDLVFKFAGGSNINPKKDPHMHSAHLRVEDAQTLKGEWVAFKDGNPNEPTRFVLTRKN